MMIKFNEVTWYSKLASIVVFVGLLPAASFILGSRYEKARMLNEIREAQVMLDAQEEDSNTSFLNEGALGDAGVITQNQDGTSLYVSKKYNFSFLFPSSWRIGDNSLGYGTFQLMNYPESETAGNSFGKGESKIEVTVLGDLESSDPNSDFPPSYVIEMPSQNGTYLSITFYGDRENYPTFERIVESLSFSSN